MESDVPGGSRCLARAGFTEIPRLARVSAGQVSPRKAWSFYHEGWSLHRNNKKRGVVL